MPRTELVRSVIRAVDILQEVAGEEAGLTLREISSRLGIKPSTLHNLARTLVSKSLLRKDGPAPRYCTGPALLELSRKAARNVLLERAAEQVRRLGGKFSTATVVFAEPLSGNIAVRLRMSPERPGFLERPLGASMHPYGTATGLVFQAFWTEEERTGFRSRYPFWEFGGHLWEDLSELDQYLEEVRRQYCARADFMNKPTCPVAAPVFGPGSEFIAAIGASLPAGKTSIKKIEALCREVMKSADALSDWSED